MWIGEQMLNYVEHYGCTDLAIHKLIIINWFAEYLTRSHTKNNHWLASSTTYNIQIALEYFTAHYIITTAAFAADAVIATTENYWCISE